MVDEGDDFAVEPDSELERDEVIRELSLLAAAHAALDPARRSHRNDILIEAALRVLDAQERATTDVVCRDLNRLFRTGSLTVPLVEKALADASEAALVMQTRPLFGPPEWFLSDDAKRELLDDAQWARLVIESFERSVADMLADDPDRSSIKDERVPKLAAVVRIAIAIG